MYSRQRKIKSSVRTQDDEVKHLEDLSASIPSFVHKLHAEKALRLIEQRGRRTTLTYIEHPFSREKYESCFDENSELVQCLHVAKEKLYLCRDALAKYQECKAMPH